MPNSTRRRKQSGARNLDGHVTPRRNGKLSRIPEAHNARLAETGIAVHLAQSPAILPDVVPRLPVALLRDETVELIELIEDNPTFCAERGPTEVAVMLGMDESLVRRFAWWELAPTDEYPTLDECLAILSPPAPLEKLGALDQWRSEIRRGLNGQRADAPSTWTIDALLRAAAYEASALELERQGLYTAAVDAMRTAAEGLVKDAQERKRAA